MSSKSSNNQFARCSVCQEAKQVQQFSINDTYEIDMMLGLTEEEAREILPWYEPDSMSSSGYSFGPTCKSCVHECTSSECKSKFGGPIYFKEFSDYQLMGSKTHPFCNECLFNRKQQQQSNSTRKQNNQKPQEKQQVEQMEHKE